MSTELSPNAHVACSNKLQTSATWLGCCAQNNKNVMPTFLATIVELVAFF